MIDAGAISELVETYRKHGWELRRVLLSPALGEKLGDEKNRLFGGVPIKNSDIDAAWFSRPPKQAPVPWEIRYLGDIQYALLESVNENSAEFEDALERVEERLREAITAKQSA